MAASGSARSAGDTPRLTILLCTYNGAAHLAAQLESYVAQDFEDWDLWISDDGSDDATLQIVDAFRHDHGAGRTIRVVQGPQQGAAANFLSLLCHPELPVTGPVALSDQDDVWQPGKLTRALAALEAAGPVTLYSGQSVHTDANLRPIGRSTPPRRPPCFRNALTQNVVSGHSMVMDVGALALVRQAGVPRDITYHDWWLYQLISGAGGHIWVDTARMILYRQHRSNAMGAHDGWRASLERIGQVLGRTYGGWIAANTAALASQAALLTPEHRAVLSAFRAAPRGPSRAWTAWRLGLHRQSRAATAAFYTAAFLGRL